MSAPHLRPDPETLGREWKAIVVEEYEQVESVREWHDEDMYRSIAHHFVDDPHRDEPILNRLRAMSDPGSTWLDVGAGGGRFALPLALVSERVTAVDPSAGMLDTLRTAMGEHGIENIDIHHLRWPEGSDRLQADYSLISHVGYDIREINPFLDGLERATRRQCVALMMDRAPSGGFIRLWEAVHGFKRQQLPAMREFLHLLLARGATPEVEIFPRDVGEWDEEHLREDARRRLWLVEGSDKDRRLQQLLDQEFAAGTATDYQRPTLVALIRWAPVRAD